MKLLISHGSALRFWREANDLKVATMKPHRIKTTAGCTSEMNTIKRAHTEDYGVDMSAEDPLEILVDAPGKRSRSRVVETHVWSSPVPQDAFCIVADGIYMSTPEFLFVQMASVLDVVELARLGNELCGNYYLDRNGGFGERTVPLTSKARIANFLNRISFARGCRVAREALKAVADNSRSPRETMTLLALCLPRRLGGYALPLPELNRPIHVPERLRTYVDGDVYTPDFLWRRTVAGKRIVVTAEYDSHTYHDSDWSAEHTRIRRNEFKAMHVLTNSINKSQLESGAAFLHVARQLARDLGIYRKPPTQAEMSRCDELLCRLACHTVY